MKLRVLVAGLVFGVAAFAADTGAELFQKAVTQERAAGNLEEAIKLYQRVAKEFASDRALAAKALVQAARCYEKLGQDKAVKIYEQVARDYRDQREPSATASARLAVLRIGDRAAAPATMTQRKIELPFSNDSVLHVFETDGHRQVYVDVATGALMIGDLAGKDKRVIFKLKTGDHMVAHLPSRDLSVVSFSWRTADGSMKTAFIKTDGTGYREREGHAGPSEFIPDWSWDNRYFFACSSDPDGTRPLVRISAADGEIRKVRAACAALNRPSPDGRFIALGASYMAFDKVFVVPSQGGEPQLVSDSARLIDWTRDGRYLIITSARSGSEALYLLPIKDGRSAGDPVFVRYGPCMFGSTVANGALVCQSTDPRGAEEVWLATLDPRGHPVDWKPLNVRTLIDYIRWSPDSTQISYRSYDDANRTTVVRLRNIAGGEEREIYRGAASLVCVWAAHRPTLFCGERGGKNCPPFRSIPGGSNRLARALTPLETSCLAATTTGRSIWPVKARSSGGTSARSSPRPWTGFQEDSTSRIQTSTGWAGATRTRLRSGRRQAATGSP
jgi:Tetratricopeptide repeat